MALSKGLVLPTTFYFALWRIWQSNSQTHTCSHFTTTRSHGVLLVCLTPWHETLRFRRTTFFRFRNFSIGSIYHMMMLLTVPMGCVTRGVPYLLQLDLNDTGKSPFQGKEQKKVPWAVEYQNDGLSWISPPGLLLDTPPPSTPVILRTLSSYSHLVDSFVNNKEKSWWYSDKDI
jgi:hypothetical protein